MPDSDELASFLTEWPIATRPAFDMGEEGAFRELLRLARAARPELNVDGTGAFAAFLAKKVSGTLTGAEILAELAQRNVADLFLVFAYDARVPGAEKLVDTVLEPAARRAHASVATGLAQDELLQELRVHLLAPRPNAPARILEFNGRSSLARWMTVAASRHALNMVRGRARELPFEEAFFAVQPDLMTPEALLMKATFGGPIRAALKRAMDRLEERERALLWFALVDGTPAEYIGKIYNVHRTTASRWIAAAVDHLRTALEEEIAGDPGIRKSELSSIVRGVLSRFSTDG
ncbi:putative DNA-binding regulatory protein [Labilithrix luteola]|uniref:Putative DNA-binding regulatory protein n=1 Tax=Labilithrix luteola TaxID=1391654 RepID=A0A0K1PLI5_9BACT|nr:hypothetical protein [Labilithrix luteola]AKU93979.1 putative DNA-binding regulatory protein [Labilithrix luteola]